MRNRSAEAQGHSGLSIDDRGLSILKSKMRNRKSKILFSFVPLPLCASVLDPTTMPLLFFIFVLAMLLGIELIRKVPSQLHTPLMSGSNAISGITIVGALIAAGRQDSGTAVTVLGTLAITFAMINVVGGYLVTDRMLKMFKSKDKQGGEQ